MLEIIQKLIDVSKSEKTDSLKIPAILCVIGCLLLFLADKIPKEVAEGGVVQVLGFLVLAIGSVLLLFVTISDTFNIPLLTGISDGIISGLLATFIISATWFAPIYQQTDDNLYIYRIMITLSYGMIYGGIVGFFVILFDRKSRIDMSRSISVVACIFILSVYFMSTYIFPKIPAVRSDPMVVGQLFSIHFSFILIFVLMYFKSIKLTNFVKPLVLYFITTIIVVGFLKVLTQKIFLPSWYGLDDEPLWDMTFYVDDKASVYAFGAIMVAFIGYVTVNTIYAIRCITIVKDQAEHAVDL